MEMIDGLNCVSEVTALIISDEKDTWLVRVICGSVHFNCNHVARLISTDKGGRGGKEEEEVRSFCPAFFLFGLNKHETALEQSLYSWDN